MQTTFSLMVLNTTASGKNICTGGLLKKTDSENVVFTGGYIKGVFGMALLHLRAALLQNSGWSSSATEFRLFLITGGSGE
jgi:hypothetical protein